MSSDEWRGMPDLLPSGMPNIAKTRAMRRWQEREDMRNWIADQVGSMARTEEQEKRDAMAVARRIAEECREKAAVRKDESMVSEQLWEECPKCHAWWDQGVVSHHWWCPETGCGVDGRG